MRKHTRILAAAMTIVEAIVIISLTGCSGKKIDYGNVLFCKLNDAPVVTLNDAITV